MKNKIYLFILALSCFCSINGYSQNPGCPFPTTPPGWFDPNWDWTLPANTPESPDHWKARVATGTLNMDSPFIIGGTNEVNDLTFTEDYKRNQGWVLMYKDFGYFDPTGLNNSNAKNNVPVFMLYNKYRSLIRLFIYANNDGLINYAYTNLIWENPNVSTYNNSLLTMGRTNSKTNDQYPSNSNMDKLAAYINDFPLQNGWAVVEFPVHFDPNTQDTIFGQRLRVILKSGTSSNVAIMGNYNVTTKSAIAKDPPAAVAGANPGLSNYVHDGQEFLGKVPTRAELTTNFNQLTTSASSLNAAFKNDLTNGIVKVNAGLQAGDLKKYLLGVADAAAGMNAGLGIIASVLKVFIAKADPAKAADTEKYVQPTISSGFLQLQGTITTEFYAKEFELQLPGTKHNNSSGCNNYQGMPYYDCAMGVVSIQEMPTINKKVFSVPQKIENIQGTIKFLVGFRNPYNCAPNNDNNQIDLGASTHIGFSAHKYQRSKLYTGLSYPIERVNSFQINGKLKLAINDAAGVEVIATKAALYFEIEKNAAGRPAADLVDHVAYPTNNINVFDMLPDNDIPMPVCSTGYPFVYNENSPTSQLNNIYVESVQRDTAIIKNYYNRAANLLNRRVLNLSVPNEDGFHSFQTPFIDLDKFDGTAITIQDSIKPYIKILVIMKPTDPLADQTPITYVMTYEIPASKINTIAGGATVVGYPMTCEQRINDGYGIGSFAAGTINAGNYSNVRLILGASSNFVTANPNGGVSDFKADNEIKMSGYFKTDLSNGNNVRMHIAPTGLCAAGGDAKQIDRYFGNCNVNPLSRMRHTDAEENQIQQVKDQTLFSNQAFLFPNPNNGNFTLLLKTELLAVKLIVVNELGMPVYEKEFESLSKINLSLNELNAGIYFLNIICKDEYIKPIKFVVQ